MKGTTIKGVLAIIVAWVTSAVGGWDSALEVLVLLMGLDYLTGVLAAWVSKKLNSYTGWRGIVRKVGTLIAVAVAHQVGVITNQDVVRLAVIMFFIGNDGLSIMENLAEMGVPIPRIIVNALELLKDKGDGEVQGPE